MAMTHLHPMMWQQNVGDDAAPPAKITTLSDLMNSPSIPKIAMVMSAYHGLRRNDSIVWGVIWGIAGRFMPILVPALALAQGYAEKKQCR